MPTVQLVLEYAQQTRDALRRNWRLSLGFFVAVILLTGVATFFVPRAYYSDARLFVRFGRTAVMDPTAKRVPARLFRFTTRVRVS